MQNIQSLNSIYLPAERVPVHSRASQRAWWVFGLGIASGIYAYALFLYASNPVIQAWVAARWPIINAPGAFFVVLLAGFIFSLPASVMGFRELRAIRRGEIPAAGRFITWVGFLLALVSSAFFYIAVLALRFVKSYVVATVSPMGR